MYEEYWKITDKPFENTPDPSFLYHSSQHEEGLYRLLYAVKEQKGAAMLTGVFGCGKTLLGRTILRELGKDVYRVAFITNPQMEYLELVMAVAHGLGAHDLPLKKTEVLANVVLDSIGTILENNMKDGKNTVVIIDEAHVIEDKRVWEGLRLLLNFQTENKFLLTLLLLGQPELKDTVDSNKQLSQRIAIRCHLTSMNLEDTKKYIQHRLEVVGSQKQIFSEEAMHLIYDKSGGIPRRINHICDLALLTGFGRKVHLIEGGIISEVTKDLEGI
ncbi:MAG: AAA family ATPase [Candidatus Omnitrophota bacterium]|nr:AAA family ATPase [Candidatus Omnitrophota bacterium]